MDNDQENPTTSLQSNQAQSPPPEQPPQPEEETWEDIPEDIRALNTDEILARVRLLENDIKVCFYS